MLDQNTDRMVNTIGIFIVAALFFVGVIAFMPNFMTNIVSSADGFDIEYTMNGGTSDMNKRYLSVRGEHTVPLDEPELDSYHFKGWLAVDTGDITEDTDLSALTVEDGELFLPGSSFKPRSNLTMVAQWTVRQHDVAYDVNGGEGDFPAERVDYFTTYTIYEHEPTRIGHTFQGWRDSETMASRQAGDSFEPTSDVTLTAQWSLDSYDVAYDLDGGSGTFNNAVVDHGDDFTISNVTPVKPGYTFTGWKDNYGNTYASGDTLTIEGAVTLKAQWTINDYTISYDTNGGNGTFAPDTVEFKQSHTIDATKPTRTGYTFKGWKNSADGKTYQPSAVMYVTEPTDVVLKAVWEINKYDVSYALNNGTGSFTGAEINYNSNYTIDVKKPVRTGYTFTGWKNSVSGDVHQPGASIRITEDTVLTAQWTINQYTVTYNLNGGGGSFANNKLNFNSSYAIHAHKPSRAGHTFAGWKSSADNKVYQAGESFTLKQNTTLTAQWKVNSYTIAFDLNGGKGTFNSGKQEYNTQFNVPNDKPTRDGYAFTGWKRSDEAKTAHPGGNFTVTQDTVLTAQWKVNRFTVTYDLNGGSGSFASSDHDYGTQHTVRSGKPTRTGYVFEGWVRSDNGNSVSAGNNITINGPVTLTAEWSREKYTVTYDANGGSGAPAKQTKTYGQSMTLSSIKPSRSGYRFDGWVLNANGSGTKYQPGTSYTREGNTTLYAKWVKQERFRLYLGSFKAGGNQTSNAYGFGGQSGFNLVKGQDYTFESRGSVNQQGLNDGKYFRAYLYDVGWDHQTITNSHKSTSPTYEATTFTANHSGAYRTNGYLYPSGGSRSGRATWFASDLFLLHPDRDNDTGNGYTVVDKGTSITLPDPAMTRKDYTFGGWKSNVTGTVHPAGARITVNEWVQFQAVWNPKSYAITYNNGSGSGGPGNTTATYGQNYTINKSSIPKLSGHVFAGWKNSRNGNYYNPGSTFTVYGPTTLTARFRGSGYLKVGSKIKIRQGAKYVSNAVGEKGMRIPDSRTIGRVSYVHQFDSHGAGSVVFGDAPTGNPTGAVHRDDIILQDPDITTLHAGPVQPFSLTRQNLWEPYQLPEMFVTAPMESVLYK